MRKSRLSPRLFLSYLWVTIGAVVLGGLYGAHLMRQFHLDQTRKDLEARARLCAEPMLAMLANNRTDEIDALCKELGRSEGIHTRITVVLPDGKVVGDTAEDPRHMDNHRDRPEIRDAVDYEHSVGSSMRYSNTTKEDRMYVAVAWREDGRPIAVVRTSIPLTAIRDTVAAIYRKIFLAGLLATVVIAAISLWISRRISRPLEEMKEGAQRFAKGDFEHRLADSDSEEIAALSSAMNDMAAQLDDRIRTVTRQQNELQAMLVSMKEGVLAVDLAGRIISLNQAFADLLRADLNELKGRLIHEVIRKPGLLQFVEVAISSTEPIEEMIRLRDTEDSQLSARGTALLDSHQRTIGVLVVVHDITKLVRLETVRRDFVANVSHELGTPITAIKGFVESLLDGAMEDPETAMRFLNIVLRQIDRLDALADDLLTLSRLESESEQAAVSLKPAPVRDVLQAAIQTCEAIAAERRVDIELECEEDLVAEIDAMLLERAVVNLIENAVKYTDRDTRVRVVGRREEGRREEGRREGGRIVLSVEDKGCGIAPNHLPRLFERFYRVDRARSRERGGTGLGLAIVKHIAVLHHGTVDVTSTLSVGSTFSIRLPAAA